MKDYFGICRGKCMDCSDCPEYIKLSDKKLKCVFCNHPPNCHEKNAGSRSTPEEGAESFQTDQDSQSQQEGEIITSDYIETILLNLPPQDEMYATNPFLWDAVCVGRWLQENQLSDLVEKFAAEEIDGESLLSLTDKMSERLTPNKKRQYALLSAIDSLKQHSMEFSVMNPARNGQPETSPETSGEEIRTQGMEVGTWPIIYKLPRFPRSVQISLEREDPALTNKEKSYKKSSLINCLFEQMSSYTWYPRPYHYHVVLSTLLQSFPFLRDSSTSGYQCLKSSLINKFKRERGFVPSEESILRMKEKYSKSAEARRSLNASEDENLALKHHRASTVLLEDMFREDDHTMGLHHSFLLTESSKENPCIEKLKIALERSINLRRDTRIQHMSTIEIVESYPYLMLPQLLLHEMKIKYGADPMASLIKNLPQIADGIIDKSKQKKRKEFQNIICSARSAEEQIELANSAALLLLPELLGENCDSLFTSNLEETSPYPLIKIKGEELRPEEIKIVVDGQDLILSDKTITISLATSLCFATYWIYSIQYPKRLKKTFTFLEHFIFHITSLKCITPVVRLHTDLIKK